MFTYLLRVVSCFNFPERVNMILKKRSQTCRRVMRNATKIQMLYDDTLTIQF